MKNEVIAMRSQRNSYDHAVRATGVTMVEVGFCDRFIDVGVRDTEVWEIKAAITERTAAIYYLAKPQALPRLPEVVAIAHQAGIPVLVDAAAELPRLKICGASSPKGLIWSHSVAESLSAARKVREFYAAAAILSAPRSCSSLISTTTTTSGIHPSTWLTSAIFLAFLDTVSAAPARWVRSRS